MSEDPTRPPAPAANMAVDADGAVLPYSPGEVRSIVDGMLADGEIIAVVLRGKDGQIGVNVLK